MDTQPGDAHSASAAPPAFRPGWRGARGLIRGSFRSLLLGQMLGQFGDGLAQIAFAHLVVFDIGHGATPARIAGVLAATLLPFSIVGPFAGVFIDRWDRRRTLITASACRSALTFVAIAAAATASEVGAYVGVLLLLSSSRFVLDAKGSALPRTVAADELVRANAISGLAGVGAAFVGAVGGAGFVGFWAPGGFLAASLAYVGAAIAFTRLPPVGGGAASGAVTSALRRLVRELRVGADTIAHTPALRRPLLAVWAHRMLLGAGFVLLVLVADRRYHLSTSGYGIALAATGVSAFFGTVAAPWLAGRWRPLALLPLMFLPPAVAAVFAGYSPTLPGLIGAVAVTAVAFQILKIVSDALVGAAAPDALRGRVFAIYDVLYNLAFVLAGLAMVPFWRLGNERRLLWWLGLAFALCWIVVARVAGAWPFGRTETQPDEGTVGRPRRWRMRLTACAAGGALIVVFPQPSWWWAAWVLLVPWLLLIRDAPTAREAALRGWWAGFGFLLAVHYWLLPSTTVFLPVAAGALAVLWMPWALLVRRCLSGPVSARQLLTALAVIPPGWVLVETARSWSAMGGPWGLLGSSQWPVPRLLAPASLGGVWLVSLLVVAVNVALTAVIVSTTWRARTSGLVAAAVAITSGPAWFALESGPTGGGTLRVAIVQAGVVHSPQQRLADEIAATGALQPGRFDLVVWGESSVGFDLTTSADLQQRLRSLSSGLAAPLLVNVDAAAPDGAIRKTAVLVDSTGIRATYDKMRLVPFGEYIPMRQVLGWLASVSKAAGVNRVRGSGTTVFHTRDSTIGPLICFENAFPDMSRTVTRKGADVLLFQVATTTFQGTWASRQHASLAAVRAVETGRPAIQASLAGTTAVFNARGQELRWWPHDRGTVTIDVALTHRRTPYDRYGDWVPAWCFVALAVAAAGWTLSASKIPAALTAAGHRIAQE